MPTQSGTLTSQPPITKPVTIQMPYGITVLQPGMKLPVISRDAPAVRVRYMNDVYPQFRALRPTQNRSNFVPQPLLKLANSSGSGSVLICFSRSGQNRCAKESG